MAKNKNRIGQNPDAAALGNADIAAQVEVKHELNHADETNHHKADPDFYIGQKPDEEINN